MPIIMGKASMSHSGHRVEQRPSTVVGVPPCRVDSVEPKWVEPHIREQKRGVTLVFEVRAGCPKHTGDHLQLLIRAPLSRKGSTRAQFDQAREGLSFLARKRLIGADNMEEIVAVLDNPPAVIRERLGLETWQRRSQAHSHDRSLKGLWNEWFKKGA